MTCPNCKKTVKDGTAVCPHCDHIIDPSFLGADIVAGGGDTAELTLPPKSPAKPPAKPAGKPPQRAAPKPAAKPKPAPSSSQDEGEDAVASNPFRAAKESQNRWAKYAKEAEDDEENTRDLPSKKPPKPMRDGKPDELGADRAVAASDQLEGLFKQFKTLCFEDKLTIVAGLLATLMIFMPWRSTAEEGDVLGILTIQGLVSLAFIASAIASVVGRLGNYIPALPRTAFPLLSVGLGGLSVVTALVTGFTSIDRTMVHSPLGAVTIANSMPSFGVWLTVAASGGVVLGGLLTFKRVKTQG
jgi:hypothetical protein